MSELAIGAAAPRRAWIEPVYAAAVFVSAALIFFLEPMVGRMLTPLLGGSPAVWNTSLAFFQAALLVGYGYAHFIQKLRSVRAQAAVHVVLLTAAGSVLPLHLTGLMRPPPVSAPVGWLLGVLALSIGAPSSLTMGTTSYILADVASAPFLWVAPLALYLLTFVIAFATRPAIAADRALLWQAPLVCVMTLMLLTPMGGWPVQLALHLGVFFLTALVCHQALSARKPEPERLTEFYRPCRSAASSAAVSTPSWPR